MATYYIKQRKNKLEGAVQQFFEDNMTEKVEQFMQLTGATKEIAEFHLTRNGAKQQEDTLQNAVNYYLENDRAQRQNGEQILQRQETFPNFFLRVFREIEPENPVLHILEFIRAVHQAKQEQNQQNQPVVQQQQQQPEPTTQYQNVVQVIPKPNELEPESQPARVLTPIQKEKYNFQQIEEIEEVNSSKITEAENKEQESIEVYNYIQYSMNTNHVEDQFTNEYVNQLFNEQITEEVYEEDSQLDYQQQYNAYNQQQMNNNIQKTLPITQQFNLNTTKINYESLQQQIEINNNMFEQLFGNQTNSKSQLKPGQQTHQVLNAGKQNNYQSLTIIDGERSSSKSIVIPDSDSSSFTIDIESSDEPKTDYISLNDGVDAQNTIQSTNVQTSEFQLIEDEHQNECLKEVNQHAVELNNCFSKYAVEDQLS
ncbi:Hypothetical_protein [Hexamita inflata]|uniref:Hypothetical_protein n=1 Tax=Hexamita inflata TaxID=28002 RepID=A0AA86UTS8_9EUKA|nr:Hypothetical protein HINF_LOCUS52006 [Hexamita inflata]